MRLYPDDVGNYFIGSDDMVWKMTEYCEAPTARFKNLVSGEIRGGAVDSLAIQHFRRLVLEPVHSE